MRISSFLIFGSVRNGMRRGGGLGAGEASRRRITGGKEVKFLFQRPLPYVTFNPSAFLISYDYKVGNECISNGLCLAEPKLRDDGEKCC